MNVLVKNHCYSFVLSFLLCSIVSISGQCKSIYSTGILSSKCIYTYDLLNGLGRCLFSSDTIPKSVTLTSNATLKGKSSVRRGEVTRGTTSNPPIIFQDSLSSGQLDSEDENDLTASGCGEAMLLAAPVLPIVDDKKNTFDWEFTPGYQSYEFYEYTLDGGTLYRPVTAKPQPIPDNNYAPGQVGVRIKEGKNNYASETLYAANGFTAGAVQENLIAFSENFDRAASNLTWQALNCTTKEGKWINPFGSPKAVYAEMWGKVTGSSQLIVLYKTVPETTYTASIFVKYDNLQRFRIDMVGRKQNIWAEFDIKNGRVLSTGSACTANITAAENGWYRVSLTFAETATNDPGKFTMSNPAPPRSGSKEGYFLFGAQLNRGNSPANYIRTP